MQTVDFFTPIVDDAFSFGRIAATNALSDIYAMGGRPLTALALLGVPIEVLSEKVMSEILSGGLAVAKRAHCAVIGGHTIRNPEPIYGLAVTGLVDPAIMLTNAKARPGDVLVLTKPLGTGIATTALKRDLCSPALNKKAIAVMSQLNEIGVELAEERLVRAATDVSGYGLLGHLGSLCRASRVGAEITAAKVPAIGGEVFELIRKDCIPAGSRDNLAAASAWTEWHRIDPDWQVLLTDAQTSGGLLLCVPQKKRAAVFALLKKRKIKLAEIGRIVREPVGRIKVT